MAKTKKMKANIYSSNCPSREILDHVTSTWGTLILIILLKKTHRFSEIRNSIEGISEKMLSQTLQYLEKDGLVIRKAYPVIPPKVEYSLSPLGKEVAKKVADLGKWVESNLDQILQARK